MKSTPSRVIAITLLLATSLQISAQEAKRTPLDEFRGTSQFYLLKCGLEAKLAFAKVELGEQREAYSTIFACLQEGKGEVKKLFPAAHAKFAKKPAASKLLKDYYAAWISALDGIAPEASELKLVYEKRQGEAARKADEIWNRFEIEAGL